MGAKEETADATAQTVALCRLIAEAFAVIDLAAEASDGRYPAELLGFSKAVATHFAARLSEAQRYDLARHLHHKRGFHGVDPDDPLPAAELLDDLFFAHLRSLGWL